MLLRFITIPYLDDSGSLGWRHFNVQKPQPEEPIDFRDEIMVQNVKQDMQAYLRFGGSLLIFFFFAKALWVLNAQVLIHRNTTLEHMKKNTAVPKNKKN